MKAFLLVCMVSSFSFLTSAQQRVTISSYIQGQYQYGQPDALLKVGDTNENPDRGFNRIGIRRGRIKVEYTDGIGTGAIQLDANDKGVAFRDLYIGVKDPWTKRSWLITGLFSRPFGYEISYSTASLESPERATVIQYFFPDERDLGAMLSLRTSASSPLNFLRLDAGLFAGNSINRETDNRKDFIGRIGAEKEVEKWGKWGWGISYYNGSVYNPAAEAYEMRDRHFVRIEKGKTGTFMKRMYIGIDGQLRIDGKIGATTLRAEGLLGVQPGIAGSSKSPNYSSRPENVPANALYKRPFLGYFFYFIQDIAASPFSVVLKYDSYDPNTKVKKNEAGAPGSYTTQTDLSQRAVGLGVLYRLGKQIRMQAYYEINRHEKSALVQGYETARKANVLTIRLQYKF